MRTSTTAWAAALAIMSMRGPFTTAEAAPARHYEDRGRHQFYPKHLRRGGYNHSSPAVESSSSMPADPDFNPLDSTSSQPPPTSSAIDEEALIESLIEAGRLPETTDAVVTTTLTLAHNAEHTATYTLTYTETSSPDAAKTPPVSLLTSSSVPIPAGTAPGSHHKQKQHGHERVTTRGTTRHNALHSLVPSPPVPLNAGSSSHPHYNASSSMPPSSMAPSSSMPTSSDAAGLLGLTNSLLGQGTKHAAAKKPHKTPKPSDAKPTKSTGNLLGQILPTESSQALPVPKVHGTNGLLPSTGGIVPQVKPKPTPPPSSPSSAPSGSYSSSADGGILLGLSSAIPNILGTKKPHGKADKTKHGGLLSDLGVSGLPTGLSLPAQSVLPTGSILPTGGLLNGGKKKPGDSSMSQDANPLGLTKGLTNLVGTATDLVGTLTNGVDSLKSQATGVVGGLTDTLKSGATGLVGTATDLVGTATDLVGTATDLVGTPTGLVDTATGLVDTATGLLATPTNLVGTATNLVGTATNLVGTATNLVGTATNEVNSLTNTLPVTVPTPTGGYTITGGGVTLTVPIPTSIATSIPITMPTPTGTGITIPTGATSIISSLGSATGTDTAETVTNSPPTYSGTAPLTGSTKLTSTSATMPTSHTNDSTAVPAETSSSVAPETLTPHHNTPAPQTIKPTGTNSLTSMTFPTSWKFAPTTWATKTSGLSTATEGSTDTAVTGLPTYMPRLVQPPAGMPNPPLNATLIQLGFNYGLNYPFVVGEPESAGQIFQYLPQGIAHGLGISSHLVTMNALMPYDTSKSLGYITTLAQAYIPSQYVDTMEMSIHMPLSEIYQNPEAPVKTLMSMINPTIPILPGAAIDGPSSSAWYNPAATATKGPGAGAPIGGDSGSSNQVRPSTVGIGIGALGGAAVYAAAMVYVARRYRQKRQGHQRASSVHTTGEMSQRSNGMAGFFMSGANGTGSGGRGSRTSAGSSNGRSVREQGISHPIMAENSLGWN